MTTKKSKKMKTECKHTTVPKKKIDYYYVNLLFQMASRIYNENENDIRKDLIQLPIEKIFLNLRSFNVYSLIDVLRDLTNIYSNEYYLEIGIFQGKKKRKPLARIFWHSFGLIAHFKNELLEYNDSRKINQLYILFHQSDKLFDFKHCEVLMDTYVIQDVEVFIYENSFTAIIDQVEEKSYESGFRPDKTKIGKKVGFEFGEFDNGDHFSNTHIEE